MPPNDHDDDDDTTLQDRPLPSLMQTKGADPLHAAISKYNGNASSTTDDDINDFYSEHKRRERAYMWHRRWAMPTYDMMRHQVKTTPGLDITEADVDLLPWGATTNRLNNAEYHRLQTKALLQQNSRRKRDAKTSNKNTKEEVEEAAKRKAAQKAEEEARRKAAEEAARRKAQEEEEERKQREEEQARINAEKERAKQAEEEERKRRQKQKEEEERKRRQAQEEERKRRQAQKEEEERKRAAEAARLAAEEERRKRRQMAPAVLLASSPNASSVEKAYRWYDLLETPTMENMLKAVAKAKKGSMDIDESDINALPWNKDGTALDFPRLHDLLEEALGHPPMLKSEMSPSCTTPAQKGKKKVGIDTTGLPSTPKSMVSSPVKQDQLASPMKQLTYTPRSTKGTLSPKSKKSHLWNALDEDERLKRRAFGWYLTLQRPSRQVMEDIIANTTGVGVSKDDVARLPWDTANQEAFVQEAQMILPSMFGADDEDKRQRQVARRAKEDAARAKEAADLETWKQGQPAAPPVPAAHVTGDVTQVYRAYHALGGPTKETFQAVLEETQGIQLTKEQLDVLPWTMQNRALDHALLAELLKEEEAAVADAAAKAPKETEAPIDPRILEAILAAYREYKELGIPKYITFAKIVDNIEGSESSRDDVSALPWDADGLYVDEGRIAEIQRRLQEQMAQRNLQEAAKKKRAEARKKRLEAAARKQKEKEQEEERRHSGEYEGDGSGKKKHKDVPLYLKERIGLRELEFTQAKEKGDKNKWEESRALKAYAWYTRMSGPNKNTLKRIVASMKDGCDVVPDDIDLLPWSASGGWVDHIKMEELSRRWKDILQ